MHIRKKNEFFYANICGVVKKILTLHPNLLTNVHEMFNFINYQS